MTGFWSTLSVRRQGYLVIVVPLLCLMGTLATFGWLRHNIDQAQAEVNHTSLVLSKSNALFRHLLSAEFNVRGYAMTGETQFLEAYRLRQADFSRTSKDLEQLVSDNPMQQQRVIALEKKVQQQLDLFADVVAQINRRADTSPTIILKKLIQNRAQMDFTRTELDRFEAEEQRLLQLKQAALQHQWRLTDFALWVTLGISVLGGVLALTLFSRLERNLREREQRLRHSKTLLQTVVANVVDGVVILSTQGTIEAFNVAAEEMFGYELCEVMGQNISLLLADEQTADCHRDENRTVAYLLQQGPRWQTLGCRKNKETFPIELSVSEFSTASHQVIAIIQDITERQQAQAKLQARADELAKTNLLLSSTNELLKERNQELDQFAYVASHDLKAPLRAIASLSEWIEEDLDSQLSLETRGQIRLIRSRVQRMDALINGLLKYARTGHEQMPLETVNVKELLDEIVEMLLPPPGFQIVISSAMPTLTTHRISLKQVFSTLIDNAIQHHPHEIGTITLSGVEQETDYEFTICDDGLGIDPRYHAKIFTMFQTLQPRDTYETTGVGLSIVKKMIELEGGKIWVENQHPTGATFHFTWPKSPVW